MYKQGPNNADVTNPDWPRLQAKTKSIDLRIILRVEVLALQLKGLFVFYHYFCTKNIFKPIFHYLFVH